MKTRWFGAHTMLQYHTLTVNQDPRHQFGPGVIYNRCVTIMLHTVCVHTVLYAQTTPKTASNTSSSGTLSAARDKIISESGSTPDQQGGGDLSRSHRYGSISYRRIGGSMTTDEVELVNSANPHNS